MDDEKIKLQKSIRNSLAKQAVDFLVPYISSIVGILTSHDINSIEVKRQLKALKIRNIRTKGDQIESSSRVLDFKVYILYIKTKLTQFNILRSYVAITKRKIQIFTELYSQTLPLMIVLI